MNRRKERFSAKQTRTSRKYLNRIRELGQMPENLEPFLSVLDDVFVKESLPGALQGKTLVGTYCVMVPQELVYAAGAVPVKLCSGNYVGFSIGDDLVPRDACPLVKAVAGFKEMGTMPIYQNCSIMAIPITCDCKKKLVEILEDQYKVYPMQVPALKEDADIRQYIEELYLFIQELEGVTHREVTWESLAESLELTGYAQRELSSFIKRKKRFPYLIRGTHALAVMNAASWLPQNILAEYLHNLNRELAEREKNGILAVPRKQPRILLTGSPLIFPNMKIPLLIEEMGGFLAADETCMGERGLSDPAVVVDESFDGMMRALANRAIRPCSCPTFADNKERIYRIKQMIRDYQIQGVIYHVLRGCLVYDFEYNMLEDELGKMGIPVIRMETDYNEEDIEQLRIRIEAFIELIKLRGED
ncbi:MAG: 2-hydroxyacyl-CoA dehydratase family protein [Eubacteriales bacterium]|nr:2-hydroxyacyl-CoA dehydratase family protein [Eubacteriales bacterium]